MRLFISRKIDSNTAKVIIEPLKQQLQALSYIGLNYLTLSRETTTLSGGESQRIKLIRHLNSPLSDLVYIIDEPRCRTSQKIFRELMT